MGIVWLKKAGGLFPDVPKLIAINGQTGKVVGNIPVDKHKRNRYFLRWFLIFCVIFIALTLVLILMID